MKITIRWVTIALAGAAAGLCYVGNTNWFFFLIAMVFIEVVKWEA